jgi:hypothetical protein
MKINASLVTLAIVTGAVRLTAQNPPPPTPQDNRPLLGRQSPPQPQQKPGLDYFAGTWRFTWTGRETPLTPGPRSGQALFARGSAPANMTVTVTGSVDEGAAYKESGTLTWDETKKSLTIVDKLAGGSEVRGTADWSSPIGMTLDSAPISVKGQTLKVRRTYSILSPTSFSVMEELSTNNGPYQRVGVGSFTKNP